MAGDERSRYCQSCQRKVHDLSTLTKREIRALAKSSGGKLCGRIVRGEKGEIVHRREAGRPTNALVRFVMLGIAALKASADETPAPSCALTVRVVDPAGVAVPQAKIAILQAGDNLAGVADKNGTYSTSVAPGKWSVQASSVGFAPGLISVQCAKDHPAEIVEKLTLQVGFTGEIVIVENRPRFIGRTKSFLRRLLNLN